ncbi:MAG: glycoside hydrolase family 127 protein [Chloroflexota bacterium]|nr:glycoside hydrolase family 127 protein [Chloroflexota bacterium]
MAKSSADERGIVVDTRRSPHARLRPVPVSAVKLAPGFWRDRLAVNTRVTLRHEFEQLEREGMFERFRRAHDPTAFAEATRFAGEARLYKWLEGAATALIGDHDAGLEAMVNESIDLIAAAQFDDGYLGLTIPPDRSEERWQDLSARHELFAAGHLFQAAIAHRRATGESRLFDVAIRLADMVAAEFGPGRNEGRPGHPEIEMALIELYRETGFERYLAAARFFVDAADGAGMAEIQGHAVKATFFAAGMADLYAETGERDYLDALERLWCNMVERKMYVTGAVGGRVRTESFGREFELPHENAYAEACAAIGSAMWNWRMLALKGEGRFADLMELCFYNSVLAGVGVGGDSFFYDVPHACFGHNSAGPWAERDRHTTPGPRERQPWFFDRVACCPPNVARTLAQLPGYIYATDEAGIWVSLYSAGEMDWLLDDGASVGLRVTTDYPWDGRVNIEVHPGSTEEFSLFLRMPGWCSRPSMVVNGRDIPIAARDGYVEVRRSWSKGDSVALDLPMLPELLVASPRVVEARSSVAIKRGPLVYCLEGVDNPDVALADAGFQEGIRANHGLRERDWPELMEGAVALVGNGTIPVEPWGGLYRTLEAGNPERRAVDLTAIPFFAWANRGPSDMTVWVHREADPTARSEGLP